VSIQIPPRYAKAEPLPFKAGPIGSGAGVLLTEYPLMSFLGKDPHTKMRTAYQMGMSVPWIRRAELLIGAKVSTVDFDLDDPEDAEIEENYPNADAVAAWDLLNRPQANLGIGQPLSRSALWKITSRHLGLVGNAFWLLDQLEAFSGTPKGIAYIRPDRMTPDEDASGNLTGWTIDKAPGKPGIAVKLDQVVHFMLEPPDSGHFGPGLVETALLRGQLSQNLDRHLASVLQAGGRLSGIISPKQGIVQGEQLTAMERDWRTITEQPDAAKRIQLIAAPVDFMATTMTPDQLDLVKLMELMRDDLLSIWNVPGSLIGISHTTGLNSGESRKYDEAALWQGPVHDRLVIMGEGIQDGILERYEKRIGWVPELVLEEPEFDDDSPRYDLLGKSVNTPLTNEQRLALVGLPPTGDPAIDKAILLPATIVTYAMAPDEEGKPVVIGTGAPTNAPATEAPSDRAMMAAGETSMGKATLHPRIEPLRRGLLALRDSIATHHTPRIREAVAGVLQQQRSEIAARIRGHAEQISRKPRDTSVWWDGPRWDRALSGALVGGLAGMATSVSRQVADTLPPAKADPLSAVDRVLSRGAARVTKINAATKDEIAGILATAVEQGTSILDIADALEAGTDLEPLIGRSGGVVADTAYRAEMIARTELMDAYNRSALYSYADAGITTVQAIDGDGDEECADRDGREYPIEEADLIEDHPNGTLDWVPVIEGAFGKATEITMRGSSRKALDSLAEILREDAAIEDERRQFMAALAEQKAQPLVVMPPDTSSFTAALDRLAESIRNQPAPVIHVAAPVVNIPPPPERPLTRRVPIRDAAGNITEVREEII
jgi:hypothetical protein